MTILSQQPAPTDLVKLLAGLANEMAMGRGDQFVRAFDFLRAMIRTKSGLASLLLRSVAGETTLVEIAADLDKLDSITNPGEELRSVFQFAATLAARESSLHLCSDHLLIALCTPLQLRVLLNKHGLDESRLQVEAKKLIESLGGRRSASVTCESIAPDSPRPM